MPFKPLLVPMNIMLTEESVNLPDKNNKCTWNMQKLNPSVDDIKITLHHYLWELKWCSTLLGFYSVSYEEENFFIPELSLFSFTPPYNFFCFFQQYIKTRKSANMKQGDKTSINKTILYNFVFQIYMCIIPLVVFFSFCVQYMYPLQKSDSKSCLGYWKLQNILQLRLIAPQLHIS